METKQTTTSKTSLNGHITGATIINYSSKRLVVLISPVKCGKSVTVGRLRSYLITEKCSMTINDNYRKNKCFANAIAKQEEEWNNPHYSPDINRSMEYLLFDVKRRGKLFCHIKDASGEDYFSSNINDEMLIPPYLREAYQKDELRIAYAIFFNDEILLSDKPEYHNYFKKLEALLPKIKVKSDCVLLLNNKADLYIAQNIPNDKEVLKNLRNQFNQFDEFYRELESRNIRNEFLTFSAGEFSDLPNSNKQRWFHSQDFYPKKLWKKIQWSFSKNWFN